MIIREETTAEIVATTLITDGKQIGSNIHYPVFKIKQWRGGYPMNEAWRNGNSVQTYQESEDKLPVRWSFVVLLSTASVVALLNWQGIALSKYIELFSNIAMFAVAAKGFFALGQPSTLSGKKLRNTLGNLTVSALAFFMNISVFGHIIRWNHLSDDLWGWHTGWIICAMIQMLFLSGFAQCVRRQVLKLPNLGKTVKNQLKKIFSALVNTVKRHDKGVLLIFLIGTVLWTIYLGSQISGNGVQATFSDVGILCGSILLLLVWTFVGILLYVTPAICQKFKWAIFGMNGKKIIIAIVSVNALLMLVLIFTLLSLMGGVETVLTVLTSLAVLAGLICAVIKYNAGKKICRNDSSRENPDSSTPGKSTSNQNNPTQNDPSQSNPGQNDSSQNNPEQNDPSQNKSERNTPNQSTPATDGKINPWDVAITILAYIVIPLILIFLMAIFSSDVRQILASEGFTWRDFIGVLLKAIGQPL